MIISEWSISLVCETNDMYVHGTQLIAFYQSGFYVAWTASWLVWWTLHGPLVYYNDVPLASMHLKVTGTQQPMVVETLVQANNN